MEGADHKVVDYFSHCPFADHTDDDLEGKLKLNRLGFVLQLLMITDSDFGEPILQDV